MTSQHGFEPYIACMTNLFETPNLITDAVYNGKSVFEIYIKNKKCSYFFKCLPEYLENRCCTYSELVL